MASERILLDFLAPVNASSELEFFRHRIHVERDSVKRAREALRHQENVFQGRQRAWKQRSVRASLEQLIKVFLFVHIAELELPTKMYNIYSKEIQAQGTRKN